MGTRREYFNSALLSRAKQRPLAFPGERRMDLFPFFLIRFNCDAGSGAGGGRLCQPPNGCAGRAALLQFVRDCPFHPMRGGVINFFYLRETFDQCCHVLFR
jgi:hypothetical protein